MPNLKLPSSAKTKAIMRSGFRVKKVASPIKRKKKPYKRPTKTKYVT